MAEVTKPTNPKDRAATTRLSLSLFPATARAYGAWAMTEGDLKYGGYNYRPAGVMSSIYYDACNRHLDKWYNGEDTDPNTQVHHLANAIACIAVLIDSIEMGNLNDDRPPRCDVGGLLSRLEAKVKHLQTLFPNGPNRYREKNNV
jgi:dATP/dGTP diphosphohydrolase